MAREYRVVSTDDHITEPPGIFDGRLPKKFADRVPKAIEDEEGSAWILDGQPVRMSGLANAAGEKVEEFSPKGKTYKDMRPGVYDPKERLLDMDLDGIDAQVCFPTLPGGANGTLIELADKEYAAALTSAYNDWLVDEWCAPDPERLLGLGILPLWDLNASADEVRRIAERGLKGVTLPSAPASYAGVAPFPDPAWDPVWEALSETGLPAEIHIATGKKDLGMLNPGAGSPAAVFVHLAPASNMTVVSTLLFSDILIRYPNLRFVSAESGIGWLPYFLERADYTYRKHRFWTGVESGIPPSELFRQSILVNYISDKAGVELRHMIGIDNIMIGTDYPHTDTSWPDTQRVIKEQMGDIPDDERHKICAGNAVRIFHLDAV